MKYKLVVLIMKWMTGLLVLLTAGCASVSEPEAVHLQQENEKNSDAEAVVVMPEKETSISPEVLYLLMTAEIAGQRNLYDVALDGYIRAAKRANDPRVSERAAKIALFLKDMNKADEAVTLWLKQDSKNLTARKIAVLSALKNGDKELAVEHMDHLLQEDPAGFDETLMEFTRVLQKEGKTNFILQVLESLESKHQDQPSIYFVQALLAGQMNRLDRGKEKIAKALELQPEWDKALILRAQLAAQSGDFDLAIEEMEKVLEQSPENQKVQKMLAQLLMKTEALDEAEDLYLQVLKNDADDGESHFAIALISLQKNRDDEALKHLRKLVNQPEWDAQASFYIGRIEYGKKNYDAALVWFDKVTRGPYLYDASMAAVSVLINQKEFQQAEKKIQAILDQFPDKQLNVWLLQAEIYSNQDQFLKAFEVLSDALLQFPMHRDLLYSRALVAEKIERLDILESDLRKILQKTPDDVGALNALGYTLVDRTERYDEAEVYLERAIELDPEAAVIIDSMGWLQYKKGRLEEALKYLRKAYEKQAETEIAAHLAEVLWVKGDVAGARKIFDKAIKENPDDEYLLKFKRQFLQQ